MERRFVASSKESFARGTQSDHIAALRAYQTYYYETSAGLRDDRTELARARSLAPKALQEMRALKAELVDSLGAAGLLSRRMRSLAAVEARARARHGAGAPSDGSGGGGASLELVAALTSAALFPRVAYVKPFAEDGSISSSENCELEMLLADPILGASAASLLCHSRSTPPPLHGHRSPPPAFHSRAASSSPQPSSPSLTQPSAPRLLPLHRTDAIPLARASKRPPAPDELRRSPH